MKRIDKVIAIINDVRNGIAHPEVELIAVSPDEMVPGRVYADVSDINIATAMQLDSVQDRILSFKSNVCNDRYSTNKGIIRFPMTSYCWYYVKIKKV